MKNLALGLAFVACIFSLGITSDPREQADGSIKEEQQ